MPGGEQRQLRLIHYPRQLAAHDLDALPLLVHDALASFSCRLIDKLVDLEFVGRECFHLRTRSLKSVPSFRGSSRITSRPASPQRHAHSSAARWPVSLASLSTK